MTYNQMINSSGAFSHQPTVSNDAPVLRNSKSIDAKTIQKINKHFQKYKKIEVKTGVPWKVVAAIDRATGYPTSMVAKRVQKFAASKNMKLTPESDQRNVIDLLNVFKKEYPDKANLLDAFMNYYLIIDSAYMNI